MSAPPVLLTRPRAQSEALAARLRGAGWSPLIWPLIEIVPTGARPDYAGGQGLILTSANAARLTPPAPLPALCVGDATAEAARAAGFGKVVSAAGDAAALVALAAERFEPGAGAVVFPRGEAVAGDPAARLAARGFAVRETVVYRAEPARAAPPEVATALASGSVAAAAFFSARTAEIFATLAAPFRAGLARTRAAAISARAARPLEGLGFREVRVAARPEAESLLRLLAAFRAEAAS